ncbi:MAG: tyrosine-type recombinase/integrase [Bacteroidetes bacterium]|jgi:integrase/recombinase XerD|nr:tyrosine-type recombinase/integrase [Bacteroidota bacterium]
MDYKLYPFKRYGKYRLYVQFVNSFGDEVTLSTGETYSLNAKKQERSDAYKNAQRKIKQIVAKHEKKINSGYQEVSTNPKLATYLNDEYYPYLSANRRPATLVSYRNALDHFLRICKNRRLAQYQRMDIEKYKQQRLEEGIRKITINIEIRGIKAAFSWAYKHDILEKHPLKGQGFLFDTKAHRRAFTDYELTRLFKFTDGKMIGLVIRLAYNTGMRVGELSAIKWKMVDLENRSIFLPAEITKTNSSRSVPLNSNAFNIVKILETQLRSKRQKYPEWYKDRDKMECYLLQKDRGYGQYERRSIQDMFRKAMKKAGLPKELTFHSLRHTFATNALKKGADIYGVSKIMGHSTPMVTSQFYDSTTALNYRDIADLL